MATIGQRRGHATRTYENGGPRTLPFPCTTLTAAPGDLLTYTSGALAQFTSTNVSAGNAEATMPAVMAEEIATALTGDLIVTLVLPGFEYELTAAGTAAVGNRLGDASYTTKNRTTTALPNFAVVDLATTTNPVLNILQFKGDLSKFSTGGYRGQSGGSSTSPTANYAQSSEGIVGDTDARAVCFFIATACGLTSAT